MKSPRWIVPCALTLVAACGGESAPSAAPAGSGSAAAEPAAEEPLPTPEEAAAAAEESIDASNADAELERLQEELGGG